MATRDAHVSGRDLGREMEGKRGKNRITGIGAQKRENGSGFGVFFPFSGALPVFSQTSVESIKFCNGKGGKTLPWERGLK